MICAHAQMSSRAISARYNLRLLRSQICCGEYSLEQLLMFIKNLLDISSVGVTTYTYKSVNDVNVYGRDVKFDFQNRSD